MNYDHLTELKTIAVLPKEARALLIKAETFGPPDDEIYVATEEETLLVKVDNYDGLEALVGILVRISQRGVNTNIFAAPATAQRLMEMIGLARNVVYHPPAQRNYKAFMSCID